MKVLFAVNNDDISNAIVKKYQKDYKQILSYKNVYYFNAILKELQKDKSYDRVVISEDLEPFANNNYDTIDKFLFDKLDSISDEATDAEGNNTDIILICTDRRSKSDDMLMKLFGIGVYNAIIGQDRSIDEVCRLINKPRTKKEAKIYYKIEAENVNYQVENEDSVSETEVQNILAHYARLGKNEDKYVDSFNNIVSQYTDNQLKIIIRYLPMGVKAVLEERSPKYQELVAENGQRTIAGRGKSNQYNAKYKGTGKKPEPYKVEMLKNESEKEHLSGPVLIPSGVNKMQVKKLIKEEQKPEEQENIIDEIDEIDNFDEDISEIIETPRRGRGRPKKILSEEEQKELQNKPKRGRGRPKKISSEEDIDDTLDLFDTDNASTDMEKSNDENDDSNDDTLDLFDIDNVPTDKDNGNNDENDEIDLFNLDDLDTENNKQEEQNTEPIKEENEDEDIDLFNMSNTTDDENDVVNTENIDLSEDTQEEINSNSTDVITTNYKEKEVDFTGLISKDKKIVSFVGTTKNGTSFIVNNAAHLLASRGIRTAILDMTKTRNAYYIYTNSDENLMKTASECIYKLKNGVAEGVKINKNLDVYTSVPEDDADYSNVEAILGTLINNYSVVLIDCDFDTPMEYFAASQEIYLVQSMDVLTIQPLTAFLRNLQSKGVLKQEKLKIVINKGVNIKSVPIATLIGGISKYNDPSMTYMKDLFDKDMVSYCVIPFEIPNYIKYLDSVITCQISLNGYTKSFMVALNELGNMIYPVLSKPSYSPRGDKYKDNFSSDINNTLNKMKRKYQ